MASVSEREENAYTLGFRPGFWGIRWRTGHGSCPYPVVWQPRRARHRRQSTLSISCSALDLERRRGALTLGRILNGEQAKAAVMTTISAQRRPKESGSGWP
jgi:hypothetical protein